MQVKFDDIPKPLPADDGTLFGRVKSFLTSETLEHFINTHQKPLTVGAAHDGGARAGPGAGLAEAGPLLLLSLAGSQPVQAKLPA